MPRLPILQKNAPFGIQNPATNGSGTSTGGGRVPQPPPVVLQQGPALPLEQFNHPDIPPQVARALNQVQQNVRQALGQAKARPDNDGNLLQNVTLSNGGANGANPNVIKHGLGKPFVGYHIHAVRGGYIQADSLIAATTALPADAYIQIWTLITAFPNATVTADIWVY